MRAKFRQRPRRRLHNLHEEYRKARARLAADLRKSRSRTVAKAAMSCHRKYHGVRPNGWRIAAATRRAMLAAVAVSAALGYRGAFANAPPERNRELDEEQGTA